MESNWDDPRLEKEPNTLKKRLKTESGQRNWASPSDNTLGLTQAGLTIREGQRGHREGQPDGQTFDFIAFNSFLTPLNPLLIL